MTSINLDQDIEHLAMCPEELIEPFVKATTEKDDLVLDVFAGSGTTGPKYAWAIEKALGAVLQQVMRITGFHSVLVILRVKYHPY